MMFLFSGISDIGISFKLVSVSGMLMIVIVIVVVFIKCLRVS